MHVHGRTQLCARQAAPATVEPCERGCPPDAQTTVGGVLVHGHTGDCDGAEPRRYVWQHAGALETGTLNAYRKAYEAAHDVTPSGVLGTELRTWDTAYEVQAERVPELCTGKVDRVRLSVAGEEVLACMWGG